ncbi:hypothetical protein LCGC14_1552280 [marine sediment metagenome]|uniref:Uncharacterized protein n=1 Tax=marine sediment metagenome TaxID=412755 RepID=A0A0F9JAY5_9ZZZZ
MRGDTVEIQNELREAIIEDIKAHGIGHTLTSVRDGIQDVRNEFDEGATRVTWNKVVRTLDMALIGPVQELEKNTKDYHTYCHPDVCTYRRKQLNEAERHTCTCPSTHKGRWSSIRSLHHEECPMYRRKQLDLKRVEVVDSPLASKVGELHTLMCGCNECVRNRAIQWESNKPLEDVKAEEHHEACGCSECLSENERNRGEPTIDQHYF